MLAALIRDDWCDQFVTHERERLHIYLMLPYPTLFLLTDLNLDLSLKVMMLFLRSVLNN